MSYTSKDLQELITTLGCELKGREYRGRCKLCGNKSLFVNPGRKKVAVVFCNNCGVDRKDEVVKALNLDWDAFGPEMSMGEIDSIWEELLPSYNRLKNKEDRLTIGNVDLLNTVYTYLLNHKMCKLKEEHVEWLESRGLPKEHAAKIGYSSTPTLVDSALIAEELYKIVGEELFTVPGFIKYDKVPQIRLVDNGIFHPSRNLDGKIFAVKIRKPKATKDNRLITMSSAKCDGPSANVFCHIPLGVSEVDTKEVWITEGERKADVVFYRLKKAVIGVPGSQNINLAFGELLKMGAKRVVMAMDKDKAGEFATVKFRYESDKLPYEFYYVQWQ